MKRNAKVFAVLVSLMVAVAMPFVANAEETNVEGSTTVAASVAKVGEVEYTSFDEAFKNAKSGDTIVLLSDASASSINVAKDVTLTINGNGHKLTIDSAVRNSGSLYFESMTIVNNYSFNQNAGAYMEFKNVTLTMDGTNNGSHTGSIYYQGAIQLDGLASDVTFDNSKVTIQNYYGSAIRWDSAVSGFDIVIKNGSEVTLEKNANGFIGTLDVVVEDSTLNVINNRGNGSNGTNITATNSTVNFSGNGSHGMSITKLIAKDSKIIAKDNGMNGIYVGSKLEVSNSTVEVSGNKGVSYWNAGIRLVKNSVGTVDAKSTIKVTDNYVSGLFVQTGASLTIEEGAKVVITNNEAKQANCTTKKDNAQMGGGIFLESGATVVLPSTAEIYNNHALLAGDDIYASDGASITVAATGANWILDDCEEKINGWYDDSVDNRWNADDTEKDIHTESVKEGTLTGVVAIKAAHNTKGTITVEYVDEDGNKIADDKVVTDYVGTSYEESALEIEGYVVDDTKLPENNTGVYTSEETVITYTYKKVSKETEKKEIDIVKNPQTGLTTNSSLLVLILSLVGLEGILYSVKKALNK